MDVDGCCGFDGCEVVGGEAEIGFFHVAVEDGEGGGRADEGGF